MSTQVTDLNLLRDQLLVRRQKLEAAATKVQTANLVQLLEEVDRALERVDGGSYGICEHCHDSMGAERLLSDPLARFCLDCLKQAEQRAANRQALHDPVEGDDENAQCSEQRLDDREARL